MGLNGNKNSIKCFLKIEGDDIYQCVSLFYTKIHFYSHVDFISIKGLLITFYLLHEGKY